MTTRTRDEVNELLGELPDDLQMEGGEGDLTQKLCTYLGIDEKAFDNVVDRNVEHVTTAMLTKGIDAANIADAVALITAGTISLGFKLGKTDERES